MNRRSCLIAAFLGLSLVIAVSLIVQPLSVGANPGYDLVATSYANSLVSTSSTNWALLMIAALTVPSSGVGIATFSVEAFMNSNGGALYAEAFLCGPTSGNCYWMRPVMQVAIYDSTSASCPSCFRSSSFTFYYPIYSSGTYTVKIYWRAGTSGDDGSVISRTLVFWAHAD